MPYDVRLRIAVQQQHSRAAAALNQVDGHDARSDRFSVQILQTPLSSPHVYPVEWHHTGIALRSFCGLIIALTVSGAGKGVNPNFSYRAYPSIQVNGSKTPKPRTSTAPEYASYRFAVSSTLRLTPRRQTPCMHSL